MAAKRELSIAELERRLEAQKARLAELLQKRNDLEDGIDELNREIDRTALVMPHVTRPYNREPLRVVISRILKRRKHGLSLAELTAKVSATGFKSGAINFANVVYQCLYWMEEVDRDKTTNCYRWVR